MGGRWKLGQAGADDGRFMHEKSADPLGEVVAH